MAFIAATHDPANVAIVCGDANIDAEMDEASGFAPAAAYVEMAGMFDSIGMDDLFVTQRAHVPPVADVRGATHGPERAGTARFDGRCTVISSGAQNAGFCDETMASKAAARIDYLFVERPRAEHSFELDLSRIRRAPFAHAGLPDGEGFLSDHIGHDLLLIASPKTR